VKGHWSNPRPLRERFAEMAATSSGPPLSKREREFAEARKQWDAIAPPNSPSSAPSCAGASGDAARRVRCGRGARC